MANRDLPYVDDVPHLHAVLSLYEMTDSQLLARRSALLGELLRTLTPEERGWLLDVVNVVYLAGYRDGAKAHPAHEPPAASDEPRLGVSRAAAPLGDNLVPCDLCGHRSPHLKVPFRTGRRCTALVMREEVEAQDEALTVAAACDCSLT